jgi:hypothetical protein
VAVICAGINPGKALVLGADVSLQSRVVCRGRLLGLCGLFYAFVGTFALVGDGRAQAPAVSSMGIRAACGMQSGPMGMYGFPSCDWMHIRTMGS